MVFKRWRQLQRYWPQALIHEHVSQIKQLEASKTWKGAYSHATKSSYLLSPCLARQSATALDSRVLWIMEMPAPVEIWDRMKLRMKCTFHGPPEASLHHLTAFAESDSIIKWRSLVRLEPIEIFMARWIAKISARLISIVGMGEENKHLKWPSLSLRTPPIADFCHCGWKDASTFHLRAQGEGGDHSLMGEGFGGSDSEALWHHRRHEGFLKMSFSL